MKFHKNILLFTVTFFTSINLISQSRIEELNAANYKQSIVVSWLISAGNSCTGYQIQRSGDSLNFEVLFDFSGICGELTKAQSISFIDEKPLINAINYYRVLIPPADYSKITSILFSDISEKGYLLFENPVNQNLALLSSSKNGKLKIYDQTGNLIKEFSSNEGGLFNENVSELSSGLFYFKIESDIGKDIDGKFIKQ